MRKLISLMHVSLDGFCAGPKGEMNWISLNDTIFADVETLIERSGAAVYGRTTYGMMRGYWPTVLTRPESSPRELKHAQWVEAAQKHTFSRTLESSDWNNVHLHKDAKAILEDAPIENALRFLANRRIDCLFPDMPQDFDQREYKAAPLEMERGVLG